VKLGDEFTVYRGDQFVAVVVVDRLFGDKAAVTVKREGGRLLKKDGMDIRQGDEVATVGLVEDRSTEAFAPLVENAWIRPLGDAALSTFSIDVDTAAYSIVRRCLAEQDRLPPPGALRIEELVNYFPYSYEGPAGSDPFAVRVDAASCPWEPRHRLVRVILKARNEDHGERPPANLVFLVDVSGSMDRPDKLPLVVQSLSLLLDSLDGRDRLAVVVYAGREGVALPPTAADRKEEIRAALGRLTAEGSTNGGAGIRLAYSLAAEGFVAGGINRVVLATDGDFNVGVTDPAALEALVKEKAKSGVYLTALGFGMDNLKDSTLERLADRGNGNYGHIDTPFEARKVLVEEALSTLKTVARDAKVQVEWNPAKVAAFRLIGYENRRLEAKDFRDDRKDAGEIGAGHAVTAFYEVVPAGEPVPGAAVDELRYQRPADPTGSGETLTVKVRWKDPEGDGVHEVRAPFLDPGLPFDAATMDFRFGAAVVAFGLTLRESEFRGSASLGLASEIASSALGEDDGGYRREFVSLVARAADLAR
jgi:Ca-activated chloride channel family protein